jgi:hypothetical protein
LYLLYFSAGTGKSTLLKAIVGETCVKKSGYYNNQQQHHQRLIEGKKSSASVITTAFPPNKKKTALDNAKKNFSAKLFENLYLLNVDRNDSLSYKKTFSRVKTIDFEELPKTEKKSCIVVEDIIHITKKEEIKLRNAINYQAHHKIQKIICASHAIYKNQIYSLLAFFNFVIFTSAISNVPTIRNVFNYFKVESDQVQRWLEDYKKIGMGRHGIYFFFDCEKMTFNVSLQMLFKNVRLIGTLGTDVLEQNPNSREILAQNERKLLQLRFEKFVANFTYKNEAGSIFSIIVNCINPAFIRSHDLTIIFFADKTKRFKKYISAVDYVNFLLSEKELPTPSLIALHRFVQSFCFIPKIFIRNTVLLQKFSK